MEQNMNHPKHEEWVLYLEGEGPADTRKDLARHLEQCPECAAEIGGWQRSIGRLKNLPLPQYHGTDEHRTTRQRWIIPALQWGIAAAIVLCVGFTLGRLSSRNPADADNRIAAKVREQLREEIKGNMIQAAQRGREEDRRELMALTQDEHKQGTARYMA